MKKIIGYKLIKPEYEEAAVKIVQKKAYNKTAKTFKKLDNINDDRIDFAANSLSHKLLDKAKVLELWFEPVYEQEEPKAGEWWISDFGFLIYVKEIKDGMAHGIFIDITKDSFDLEDDFDEDCKASEVFELERKATSEEIEQALTKVCEQKYPDGCRVRSLQNKSCYEIEPSAITYYYKGGDSFAYDGIMVYKQGQFAEIVEEMFHLGLVNLTKHEQRKERIQNKLEDGSLSYCNNDALEIIEFVLAQNSCVEITKKEYKKGELVGIDIRQ